MAENRGNKVSFQQDFSYATATSGNGGAGGRGGDIGSYNTTTTNYFVREKGNKKVLEPLSQHIAPGALHDSAERFDAPKCHPHTREAIIQEIIQWTKEDAAKHPFLWVYGPAGTGKSSIAQSVAEILFKEGKAAASFFFSRTATGRNDASRFIATLAYQLALNTPKMDGIVAKAIDHDPAIFSKSLDTQTEALIVEPLAQLSRSATAKDDPHQPQQMLIIIDGLDECGTPESQRLILTSLLAAVQKLPNQLCFLIASRPEYQIRSFFNDSSVHSISWSLVLDDRYQPDKDIALFLRSRFSDIKSNHPSGRFLPPDWPADSDINRLVQKASGQFIYASTVMKFVESPRRLPMEQLNIVLGLTPPGKNTPFAGLDFLYTYVFGSVDDNQIEKVMMVFVFLLLGGESQFSATPGTVEGFLRLQEGELHTLLIDLHSVIHIPDVEKASDVLHLHHASLGDFLLDRARSGRFFIDVGQGHVQMAKYCMKHFVPQSEAKFNMTGRQIAYDNLEYHCRNAYPVQDLIEDLDEVDFEAYLDIGLVYNRGERSEFIDRVITQFLAWIRDIEIKYGSPEKENGLYAKYLAQFDRNVQARLARYPSGPMACHLATAATLSFPKSLSPNVIFRNLISGLQPPVHSFYDYEKADFEACYFSNRKRIKGFQDLVTEVLKDRSRSGPYHVNSEAYRNLAQFCITVLQFDWFQSEKPILPAGIKQGKKKMKEFEKFYFDLLLSVLTASPLDPELAKYMRDNLIPNDSMHFCGKERTDALQVIQSYIEECENNLPNKDQSFLQGSLTTASVEDMPDDAVLLLSSLSEESPTTVVGDDHLSLSNKVIPIPLERDSRVPSEEPITVVSEESKGISNQDDRDQTVATSTQQGTENKKDGQGLGDDLEGKRRNLEDLERRLRDWEDELREREKMVVEERKKLAENRHAPQLLLSDAPPPDYDTFEFATSIAWPGAVTTILRGQPGLGKAIKKKHQTVMDDWVKRRGVKDLNPDSYDCLLYSHGVAWPKAILDSTTDAHFLLIRTKFLHLMNAEGYQF